MTDEQMHVTFAPKGQYAYVIGNDGDWHIYVTHKRLVEPVEVMAEAVQVANGLPNLATSECFLEALWGEQS